MRSLEERFTNFVSKDSATGCWNWTGSTNSAGYGRISVNGRARFAHRVAYELFIGPFPEGLETDHLCRNRSCVNPEHLEAVTRAENVRRSDRDAMIRRGKKGGRVTGDRQRSKTHCPQGHPYDEVNTYVCKQGTRKCRACIAARKREERSGGPGRGSHNKVKTHCKNGHEYTEENTYMYKGSRFCRTCNREAAARYRKTVTL